MSSFTPSQQEAILTGLENEFGSFSAYLYPLLPDKLRVTLILKNFNQGLDKVAKFFPINSLMDKKIRIKLQTLLLPPEEFTNVFVPPLDESSPTNIYFDSITDVAGAPDYTYKKLNTSIDYYKMGVVGFNINWNGLEAVAGVAAAVLKPSLTILTETHDDMLSFLADDERNVPRASAKQANWTASLYSAKSLLLGLTSESNTQFDSFAQASQQSQVDTLFGNLITYIESSSENSPHNQAWRTANQYLSNADSEKISRSAGAVGHLLAGAQSVRFSLLDGIYDDRTLQGHCLAFTTAVENLEGFDDMKNFFDNLISSLGASNISSKIADALRLGNLSSLLSELGVSTDLSDWLIGCLTDGLDAQEIDAIVDKKLKKLQRDSLEALSNVLQVPSFPEFERWNQKKTKILNDLKNRLASYNDMIDELEDPRKVLKFSLNDLDVDDPCSMESVMDAIGVLLEEFIQEVEETYEELTEEAGGALIAILVVVMAEFLLAEVEDLMQQYQLDTLFGNLLKTLVNAIAMVLVTLNGAKLYLQYLAVTSLYNEAYLRERLGLHLSVEMTSVVKMLQQAANVSFDNDNQLGEIEESQKYVRKAKLGVGLELGKVLNGKMPSNRNLLIAQNNIQLGIDALVPTGIEDAVDNVIQVNDLISQYNMDTNVTIYTNQEMTDLASAIKTRFFTINENTDYSRFLGQA